MKKKLTMVGLCQRSLCLWATTQPSVAPGISPDLMNSYRRDGLIVTQRVSSPPIRRWLSSRSPMDRVLALEESKFVPFLQWLLAAGLQSPQPRIRRNAHNSGQDPVALRRPAG